MVVAKPLAAYYSGMYWFRWTNSGCGIDSDTIFISRVKGGETVYQAYMVSLFVWRLICLNTVYVF